MGLQEAHGAHARAERLGRRILEIQEKLLEDDLPERAVILQRLGHLQELQGQPQRAESYYRSALEGLRAHFGQDDPALAPLLGRLGALALGRGEEQQAERGVHQEGGAPAVVLRDPGADQGTAHRADGNA